MDILSLLRNSPGAQAWLAQQAPASALAAVGISPREALDREMSYDGSHPRQQEQAARDHFRSYGPNMLMDALIPGYGAGGDAKAASEAYGEGRYGAAAGNALMAAMDFVPVLGALPAAAKGIRAFHGSPHDFDRFDMSKIGTGEGAQAYGYGLYFAENESVARGYRDALAPKTGTENLRAAGVSESAARALKQFDSGLSPEVTLRDWLHWTGIKETPEIREAFFADFAQRNPGRMYEVNINADPEAFLDWDKPLSEQSPAVREAAAAHSNAVGFGNPLSITATGKDIAGRFTVDAGTGIRAPAFASKQLREAGIPGIKYLDAGSRGAGDGSRNYVVFDDRLITILRKYGIGGLIAGGGAYALTDAEYAQAAELLAQDGMNTGAQ